MLINAYGKPARICDDKGGEVIIAWGWTMGLSIEEHVSLGDELRAVRRALADTVNTLSNSYGKDSGEAQQAVRALSSVESLRRTLNDSVVRDGNDMHDAAECYYAYIELRR